MKGRQTFKVHMHQSLSAQDHKVLSFLYQPVIGKTAFGLYMILLELSKESCDKDLNHQFLADLLNLRVKDLLDARQKLEALNLLETYQDLNQFIYLLKQPCTAQEFLVDTILGKFLESEIGVENVQRLAHLFEPKKYDLNSYENVSKNFDDIFEFKTNDLLKLDFEVYGKMNARLKINHSFNYETFLNRIKSHHKSPKLLDDQIQEKIAQIAFVYGLSEIEISDLYNENANGHLLSIESLDMFARLDYEKKQQTLNAKNKKTSDQVFDYDKIDPRLIVQKFASIDSQGMALSTIRELIARRHIAPGVLNILIAFVLKHKEGILPNANYLEKVLDTWTTYGVKTTQDALNHVMRLDQDYQSRKESSRPVKKSKIKEPDWLDRYLKEIEEMG